MSLRTTLRLAGLLVFSAATPALAQDAKAPAEGAAADARPSNTAVVTPDDEVIVKYPPAGARWRALVAGSGMTLVAYGGSALMGALWDQVPGSDMLFIPVAGPWIAVGKSGCAPSEETTPGEGDCEALIGLRAALFIVDGLLQAAGLVIVGEGIFMKTEDPEAPPKAAILPMPIVSEHSVGFGVMGTF
jgi:hypothetical protein